jgi:hypothetical protein
MPEETSSDTGDLFTSSANTLNAAAEDLRKQPMMRR